METARRHQEIHRELQNEVTGVFDEEVAKMASEQEEGNDGDGENCVLDVINDM